MRNHSYLLVLTTIATLLVACAKEQAAEDRLQNKDRINAGLGEDSKISLTDQTSKLALAWQTGDVIRINGASSSTSEFTILPGFSAHNATFAGEALLNGPYTLIYPGKYASASALNARDLSVQTQNGNGSTAHLEYNAILSNVSDYHSFSFTSAWASANSATFKENAVLKVVLQVPSGITSVSQLTLAANSDVFYKTNGSGQKTSTLTLNMENVSISTSDYLLTAYFDLSLQAAKFLATTSLTATVTTNIGSYSKLITPGAKTLSAGKMYIINFNDGNWTSPAPFAGGDGTQAHPYLIANYLHLNNMGIALVDDQTVYFELIADVDMNPNDAGYWTPVNDVSPYSKGVHLDGKGHHIKNFTIKGGSLHNGMFCILNGTVQNLTFDNPKIIDNSYASTSNHDVGFITGFAGYTANSKNYSGIISYVNINNGEISTNSSLHTGGVGFGAIAGTATQCTISHCHVKGFSLTDQDGDGTVPNIVGGLVGRTGTANSTIEYCSAKNLNLAGFSFQGGILGYHNTTGTVQIDSCKTSGTIKGNQYLGGIVGGAAKTAVGLSINRAESSCNLTVTGTSADSYLGGIMGGHLGTVSISNSKASGAISAGAGLGNYTGGILGNCALAGCSITGCTFSGTINVGGNYVAGILGKSVEQTTLNNCKCSATITSGATWDGTGTAPDGRLAGIVGQLGTTAANNSTISNCVFSGEIKSNSSYSKDAARYIGGIGGAIYGVNIHHCLVTGKLGGKAHELNVGGIAAYANVCTATACEFRGSTTYATGTMGGMFATFNGNSSITNCLFNGTLTGGYNVGGIVSNPNNSANTLTFSNNLILGKIKGIGGVGGVIGLMGRTNTSGSMTVEKNLVYATSIEATRSQTCASNRSSAHIIGEVSGTVYTLKNTNYFSSSVSFVDGASGVSDRVTTPTEQTGNYTTSSPLTWSYSATYFHPYYGRKTTATASTQATTLGWSTTYWDLSGSTPALKNMPSVN